jgi:hypothetical protein
MNNLFLYILTEPLTNSVILIDMFANTIICSELNININLNEISDRFYMFGNGEVIIANGAIYTTGNVKLFNYNEKIEDTMFSRSIEKYLTNDILLTVINNKEASVTTFFNTFIREFCGSILLLNVSDTLSFSPIAHGTEAIAKENVELYFYIMNINDIKYILNSNNITLEQTSLDYILTNIKEKVSPYWNNILKESNKQYIKDNFYKCTINKGDNIFYINSNLNAYLNRSKILIRGI